MYVCMYAGMRVYVCMYELYVAQIGINIHIHIRGKNAAWFLVVVFSCMLVGTFSLDIPAYMFTRAAWTGMIRTFIIFNGSLSLRCQIGVTH